MDRTENIETTGTGDKKQGRNWKESKLIFLVIPITLTVLLPLGGLPYLCGRFSPYAISFAHVCMLFPAAIFFIIFCFVVGIGNLYRIWKKRRKSEKFFISGQILIPLVFLVLLISSFFLPESDYVGSGYKFFLRGFRNRVRGKADIEGVRNWMRTLDKEDYDEYGDPLFRDDWPESLKVFNQNRLTLLADENDNPKVRLMWGSGFMGHWYFEIGMENMEVPKVDVDWWADCWLLVEPGVYVWYRG